MESNSSYSPKSKLCLLGNPVLTRPCDRIEVVEDRIADLAHQMHAAMVEHGGLGLAGPQIGISKQIFVYDMQDGRGPGVIINPRLSRRRGKVTGHEGCLSVPGFTFNVARSEFLRLEGQTFNFLEYNYEVRNVKIDASGLMARLFQHEVDHLNGNMIVERISKAQKQVFEELLENGLNLGE